MNKYLLPKVNPDDISSYDLTSIEDDMEFLKEFFSHPANSRETFNYHQANLLRRTSRGNRNALKPNSEGIAYAMLNGLWRDDSTICFGWDGVPFTDYLGDGHHRLDEQVKTKKTLTYLVRRRMTRADLDALDKNAPRNTLASVTISSFNKDFGRELNKSDIAFMKSAISRGNIKPALNKNLEEKALMLVRPGLNWIHNAFEIMKNKSLRGVSHAAVQGVFLRAYMSMHNAKGECTDEKGLKALDEALKFLLVGKSDSEYDTHNIWMLREYLVLGKYPDRARLIYNKSNRALSKFLRGEKIGSLTEAKGESFDIKYIEDQLEIQMNDDYILSNILTIDLFNVISEVIGCFMRGEAVEHKILIESILAHSDCPAKIVGETITRRLSDCFKSLDSDTLCFNSGTLTREIRSTRLTVYFFVAKQ